MELIPRDRGTAADIGHSYAHTKILQCLLQLDSGFPVFLIRERAGALSFFQKCDRREDVLLLHHFLLLFDLLDHAEISSFLFLFLGLLFFDLLLKRFRICLDHLAGSGNDAFRFLRYGEGVAVINALVVLVGRIQLFPGDLHLFQRLRFFFNKQCLRRSVIVRLAKCPGVTFRRTQVSGTLPKVFRHKWNGVIGIERNGILTGRIDVRQIRIHCLSSRLERADCSRVFAALSFLC